MRPEVTGPMGSDKVFRLLGLGFWGCKTLEIGYCPYTSKFIVIIIHIYIYVSLLYPMLCMCGGSTQLLGFRIYRGFRGCGVKTLFNR